MAEERWPGLLAQAWAALTDDAGGAIGPPATLEVTGDRGYLPSRLPVEDTAIACAGAALLAAVLCWPGGRPPGTPRDWRETFPPRPPRPPRLDREHLAAAFRSEAYLRVNGERSGAGFAPLSRFWRAGDGWVRTHANYHWHREALLEALGTTGEPEAVATAIAGLGAREVETLVTEAGGVAAAVRGEDSWRAEPAGQAVAAVRLVETAEIAGAPPRPRGVRGRSAPGWQGAAGWEGAAGARDAAGPWPASGLRVLDLTRVIAGPVATRYLGALGADVLRIDPPHRPELPAQAYDSLLGKRSAVLNVGTSDGNARLHELLSGADVLVHGYRPHALDRFGLSPAALAERHPGLVTVSLSAWGSAGPWGGRRGFDSIVQAASGIAMVESADGEVPGAMPCQLLDHGTGYLCAAAALCALARQAAVGGTQFRELALARTAHWLLGQPRNEASGPTAAAGQVTGPWFTAVSSADGPVTAVLPPGQLDGRGFSWPETLSRYGGDPPAWAT